jgi:putative ABC transport system ATP-binding protein
MSEVLIDLSSVEKVFLTDELETHALSDVHLRVNRGEYVAIEGPSGSGKTTLLSILGLLDVPSKGKYLLGGREVSGLDAKARAKVRNLEIGFVFQTFNLIGDLTVFENVELPLRYRNVPAAEQEEARRSGARQGADEPPAKPHAEPALGRAAAARRGGARGRG